MRTFWQNFRHALRLLKTKPGFTAVAVLTLALGIGANTAIFSVVYGALLAPLPYPHADQLVMVWSKVNGHNNGVSTGDYLDWKRQSTVFQDLVAWTSETLSLSISGRPEAAQARITTPGFFRLQGIPFSLGRDFVDEEGQTGKDHVVVMSHRVWRDRFGSDTQIIGKQVRLNGEFYSVVGVLAEGMPDRFEAGLFLPLAFRSDQMTHDVHWLVVMGRLKPSVTLAQANADMDSVTRNIAQVYPLSNKGWGVSVEPLKNDFTSQRTINNLWLLMAAVGFVLLIACANVANLLLARGTTRQKEVAVRAALGATRGQIFWQLLTESLTLAFTGAAFGVLFAWALLKAVVALMPPYSIPTEADVRLNWQVLFFSLAATVVAGVLCGCAPAWQSSRSDLHGALKEGGRSGVAAGKHGPRRALVIAEFAMALTLLASAGLVIHSFWKLTRVNLGFRQDHILTFTLPLANDRFANPEQTNAFYRQLLERLEALPGVSTAAVSTGRPISGAGSGMAFHIAGQPEGDPASRPSTGFSRVTPGYFRTFGIEMAQGRGFTEQDVAGTVPVAVVNETFVKKYLPNTDPLTQRVAVAQFIPNTMQLGPPIEWQIVGVYRDVHNSGVRGEGFPEMNVPFWQSPRPSAGIEVRTEGDPATIASAVGAAIQSVDSDLPLDNVRTMDQIVGESLAGDRFVTVLFAAFAGVALLLAAVGIYGVMSFTVAQRTHEIGLRMALGAEPRQVLGMVVREGMLLALAGLALGLGGAYFAGRAMKSVLYEVTAIDPVAVGAVASVLLGAALLACFVPAQRAARVSPLEALRCD